MTTAAEVIACGRSYINTPFLHMGRQPGLALDCAGVLVCCARDLGVVSSMFDVPAYQTQPDGVSLIQWCEQYLGARVRSKEELAPSNVVVVKPDKYPQHLGLVADYKFGGLSIIHACNTAHPPRVVETRLMFSRDMKFVCGYKFVGVVD